MISVKFLTANRLNRLLDAVVEQERSADTAQIAGIDPDLAQTALAVQRLATIPKPDIEFTDGLLRDILAGGRSERPLSDIKAAAVKPGTWKGSRPLTDAWTRPQRSRLSFSVANVATAALVLLTLASVLAVVGPGRARWSEGQPRPALSIASPAATSSEEVATIVWKSRGDPTRPINNPGHLTVDPAGNLWVVDPGDSGFQIWSPDGELLEKWGEAGTGPGQFHFEIHGFPSGAAAFDAAGNLYVADAGNWRVQKFSPDRSLLRSWGSKGTGNGQFLQPDNLAIDQQGRVYVLDGDRDDIQVFDADGTYLQTIGRYGIGEGQFLFFDSGGLTIDGNGNLWVADISNQRIQIFSPDGTFQAAIGKYGFHAGEFASPNGVAVDGAGIVYVVDAGKTGTRVQMFSADGAYLGAWSDPDGRLSDLSTSNSIVLDSDGSIYVTDYPNDVVLKLQLLSPLPPAP